MRQHAANISILIMGLRGAGKTTLARSLAARISRPFIDLDARTLAIMGVDTVARAWREQGEPAFRDAEVRALREALNEQPSVISLGGGTPAAPGGSDIIRDAIDHNRAIAIYLHADPDVLAARVRNDPPEHRPRLLGLDESDALEEMRRVFALRDPIYRSLATYIIDAEPDADTVLESARRIMC